MRVGTFALCFVVTFSGKALYSLIHLEATAYSSHCDATAHYFRHSESSYLTSIVKWHMQLIPSLPFLFCPNNSSVGCRVHRCAINSFASSFSSKLYSRRRANRFPHVCFHLEAHNAFVHLPDRHSDAS
jgi:hypothetical protein